EEEDGTNNKNSAKTEVGSEKNITVDPLYELFQRVFVNNSWNCASPIEKPYYSAGIFSLVCYLCGNQNVTKSPKSERSLCVKCNGKPLPKKQFKWAQSTNKKGKQRRTK
ncbi:11532_t:CDS:1, partial [Racocetra persica]